MMNLRRFLRAALVGLLCLAPAALSAHSDLSLEKGMPSAERWAAQHFRKGVLPPFSFRLDGVSSDTFLRKWKFSVTTAPDGGKTCCWQDPSTGLRVFCKVDLFPDFNAVEWVVSFRNDGAGDSPQISDVHAADLQIRRAAASEAFVLNHLNGSLGANHDFAPYYDVLTPGPGLAFRPNEGRSTSGAFPYYNIIVTGKEDVGAVFSIGWSGVWRASFALEDGHPDRLGVQSGLNGFDAFLHAGEEVRMPRYSLMFWQGGHGALNMTGNNKFRRFVLAHHSRKIDGKTAMYPLCGGFNWGEPAPLNEYTGMTADYGKFLIDRYADFDITPDAMWLDAGWYKRAADWRTGKNWYNTAGSWTEDPVRFPNTLREISDRAHERGMKMMVWFEPERVFKGSDIYLEHRDWLITVPGEENNFLLNLGNPEARRWLTRHIGDFLDSRGIDYYRQDFNIDPAPIWAATDEPGRKGITEIKYIEGLYAYWDGLLARFPQMLIDNCAGGGRRLDLELIGRGAPLWRTDYSYGEVNGYQNQTYGLEWFLPLHGTGVYETDRYASRSAYSSAMVMNFKLTDGRFNFFEMKRVYDEYRSLQPYYVEDYYPLSGVDDITSLGRWIVYQLHRPSDDTGCVLAFRRPESREDACTVRLQGLTPERSYVLTDADSGEQVTLTGAQLAEGYTLRLPDPRSSLLLRFAPAK